MAWLQPEKTRQWGVDNFQNKAYLANKKDKWWKELEYMKDYIEEEVKRIVESKEE